MGHVRLLLLLLLLLPSSVKQQPQLSSVLHPKQTGADMQQRCRLPSPHRELEHGHAARRYAGNQ